MGHTGITLLGLGPGNPNLLTREAWHILDGLERLYLRTRHHPVIDELQEEIELIDFDDLFQEQSSSESLQSQIPDQILALGKQSQGVVYAVPGHPLIDDKTSLAIAQRARQEGLPLYIVDAVSSLDAAFSALELPSYPQLAIVDAVELVDAHVPPFSPSNPTIIAQVSSSVLAGKVKQVLMSLYPGEHRVKLVHLPGTDSQVIEEIALNTIDQCVQLSPLTFLYLPSLGRAASFESFQEVIAHLRAPDGCPWDREQTHRSLRPHLLEETYELLNALDSQDVDSMREEFGDLLLQIVLHAQIASESGDFTISDVLYGIHTKIVNRHPHVFSDLTLEDTKGVLLNWERLKEKERAENGKAEASLLDGVAVALPALVQAEQFQKRAARVGFDWPDIQGVLDKLEEELREVNDAEDGDSRADEIGDLLFAVVNLARWYKIDPESSLRETNERFRKRFSYIEKSAHSKGQSITDLSLDEMESLWQEAKKQNL
jgi:tetrapyrrole methylase family protein/MazG family protein